MERVFSNLQRALYCTTATLTDEIALFDLVHSLHFVERILHIHQLKCSVADHASSQPPGLHHHLLPLSGS